MDRRGRARSGAGRLRASWRRGGVWAVHGAILEIMDKIVNNPGANIFYGCSDGVQGSDLAADY
jgi:hypothetical protein